MANGVSDSTSFDIIDAKWLDMLRTDGTVSTLSLREVLATAHQIARLSEPSPLTDVALLRFLIALVSDGLRRHVPKEDAWAPFVERCRNGLPSDAIDAILAPLVGRSNVLDPNNEAFFDRPAIRRLPEWDKPEARQPVWMYLPGFPTGTLRHFDHLSHETAALCIGCLVKSRMVESAFARGGLGPTNSRNLLSTISGDKPQYVIPIGNTLLDTILVNLVIGDPSRPSWISIHTRKEGAPGPIAGMTWRPRLMMPLTDSETSLPCDRCGMTDGLRFAKAVIADTYRVTTSPYGSEADVKQWKTVRRDPHVLAPGKTIPILERLRERSAVLRPVTIMVTKSAGNQAKIDDAPHAALDIPPGPLSDRVDSVDPEAVLDAWLRDGVRKSGGGSIRPSPQGKVMHAGEVADGTDLLREAAKRIINRLAVLPPSQLLALRPPGKGAAADVAARQDAFEAVWHRVALPIGSRRHALRESLATVAPIYATYSQYHRPLPARRSFEEQLYRRVEVEQRSLANTKAEGRLQRALRLLVFSSRTSRDRLLLELVDEVIHGGPAGRTTPIDFADLLHEIACWNEPRNPTLARWRRLLPQKETEPSHSGK